MRYSDVDSEVSSASTIDHEQMATSYQTPPVSNTEPISDAVFAATIDHDQATLQPITDDVFTATINHDQTTPQPISDEVFTATINHDQTTPQPISDEVFTATINHDQTTPQPISDEVFTATINHDQTTPQPISDEVFTATINHDQTTPQPITDEVFTATINHDQTTPQPISDEVFTATINHDQTTPQPITDEVFTATINHDQMTPSQPTSDEIFATTIAPPPTEVNASSMSPLFQCLFKYPVNQNRLVYTPNIPNSLFNPKTNFSGVNLTQPQSGFTYIFTIPSESPLRNCSGTVVSLQYCYKTINNNSISKNAFNFLSLSQDGTQFTVKSRVAIQRSCCNLRICCCTTFLRQKDRFNITCKKFVFGVVINNNVQPLAFAPSITTEYHVEQYRVRNRRLRERDTFSASPLANYSLLLLRFFIDYNGNSTPVCQNTSQEDPTNGNSTPYQNKVDSEENTNSALIGGVIGGFAAVLALIAIIACGMIMMIKYQMKHQPERREGTGIGNVYYSAGRVMIVVVVVVVVVVVIVVVVVVVVVLWLANSRLRIYYSYFICFRDHLIYKSNLDREVLFNEITGIGAVGTCEG